MVFGLVFLWSASSVVSFQKWNDTFYTVKHQLLYGFLPGLIGFLVLARLPYERLRKFALPALVVSWILLAAVFVPGLGYDYGGAKRWLHFGAFILQPAELVKLLLVVYLAAWLEKRNEDVKSFVHGVIPFVLIVGSVLGLIILQPDIGTMSVVAVSAFVMLFVAGLRWYHLFGLGAVGVALGYFIVKYEPYRVRRLTVFLHPELDPQGIGYHINQALLAVGSGGWFGVGLGYSRQKYQYLPEVVGDSIFAIIAEEIGFIFSVLFLALIGLVLARGFRIAARAPDMFGKYLAIGIVTWFAWQTCINIGSMVGLLPLTGVPLPFVSAGGTALAVNMAAVGILVSISRVGRKSELR